MKGRNHKELELVANQLRMRCDPNKFSFESTAELGSVSGLINQERALGAIEIAVNSQDKRSNLRIVQPGVTSRASATIKEIRRAVRERYNGETAVIPDICLVDVSRPDVLQRKARPLMLAGGKGNKFQKDIKRLSDDLRQETLEEFNGPDFAEKESLIHEWIEGVGDRQDRETTQLGLRFEIDLRRIHMNRSTTHVTYAIRPIQIRFPKIPSDEVEVVERDPVSSQLKTIAPIGTKGDTRYRIRIDRSKAEYWLLDGDENDLFGLTLARGKKEGADYHWLIPEKHWKDWVIYERRNERISDINTIYYCVIEVPPEDPNAIGEYWVLDKEGERFFEIMSVCDTRTNALLYWGVFPAHLRQWTEYAGFSEDRLEEFLEAIRQHELHIRKDLSESRSKGIEKHRILHGETVADVFDKLTNSLRKEYPEAGWYFDELREYTSDIAILLRGQKPGQPVLMQINGGKMVDLFVPFTVNVLVSSDGKKEGQDDRVPIIYEEDPTFENLFGRISRPMTGVTQHGVSMISAADHMALCAGSLLRANGGYLIIPMDRLLKEPTFLYTWNALVKAVRNEKTTVQDMRSQLGFLPSDGLEQEAIPLNVRIVIITSANWDMLFSHFLPEDYGFFRVKGELVSNMPRTPENELKIAQILGDVIRNRGMDNKISCSKEACALFVEYASLLAGDQRKLSLDFNRIKAVLVEAEFWARKRTRSKSALRIKDKDVRTALERKVFRSDAIQRRIIELMRDGVLKVDVAGSKVGRINGLAVYDLGDYAFGKPTVISAQTRPGKQDIVNVEAEVEHAGPIQKKSVHIVAGFLDGKFFQDKLPALHARLVFEQAYDGIEGDSASVAEFLSLLSRLADVPLKQSLAVTGSCNQDGEVQAIGGQNQKVEGFFDTCKAFAKASGNGKLPGDQGVVLPKDNVQHLMLREDVVDAVRNGKFHVYAVSTLDEAIKIFTGIEAEEVYRRANEKLAKYSEIALRSRS